MIIAESPIMKAQVRLAQQAARSNASIFICGENGTGKELFAQLIHDTSSRHDERLVRVNCAALSDHLVESELFGHEKGAFTDAAQQRLGRFEIASGGSLFLDEVTEVSMTTQAKLLRVLESGEFERVGSNDPITHDARIIASSNRDLTLEVIEGRFRRDLYHRLNVIQIMIPPLRDRPEDIPALVGFFVDRFQTESLLTIRGVSSEAIEALIRYSWPGNVRELRNVIHRACVLTQSELIGCETLDLQIWLDEESTNHFRKPEVPDHWLERRLSETEQEIILAAIERYGSQRIAADRLGVSPRTVSNKLRGYRDENSSRAA